MGIGQIAQILPGKDPYTNTTVLHYLAPKKPKNKKEVDELDNNMNFLRDVVNDEDYLLGIEAETSAQIGNATNGIEPPRALVSYKQSKDGVMAQVVPQIHNLKNKYDLLWDQKGPDGYIKIMAVIQKYVDQGMSINTSYNPAQYEDNKVPMSEMMKDLITFYKYGGKQLYYFNTNDMATEDESTMGAEFNGTDDEYEEYCDSCAI